MHDLIGLAASVALPWLAGGCCVLALQRGAGQRDLVVAAGYGYLLGALATSLAMRALDAIEVPWTPPLIALQLVALAAVGCSLARLRSLPPLRERWLASRGRVAALSRPQRLLFVACLALIVVRLFGLGLELAWRPLLPWDAWAQWATKARVWYEYGSMAPFVDPARWLESGSAMQFVDAHPEYPGTVPLLQVWTALCLGRWDESLMNVPWLAILAALGLAFYAQLRRIGIGMVQTMLFSYLLLSIPFIDLHVAVAGYVDIFIAAAYGMSAMALWQWVRTRGTSDALLAVSNHVLGYTLRTKFSNVWRPLFEHFFEMDNWHLLWYLTPAVIALRWRALFSISIAPMTVTMLGAFAFVFIVFFYSSAAFGVADETLVNRLPLHMVPALAFYLVFLWRQAPQHAAGGDSAPAHQTATMSTQ